MYIILNVCQNLLERLTNVISINEIKVTINQKSRGKIQWFSTYHTSIKKRNVDWCVVDNFD